MDSPDPRSAVEHLISVLRKATRVVQLTPFVFLFFMAVYLLTESLLPCSVTRLADIVFDIPLVGTAAFLFFGRLFKLCAWFRTACFLPMVPKAASWTDAFLVTFTQGEIVAVNMAVGLLFLLFITLSVKHFFYGKQQH